MRFIAFLASHLEAAGCEVHHVSADGDRLFILMALGVADEGSASVLVGYHKPSHNFKCPVTSREAIFNTNPGKLRPSIQSLQKRGHVECIGDFGSITQRQA